MKRAIVHSSVEAIPLLLYIVGRGGLRITGSMNSGGNGLVTFALEGDALPEECEKNLICVTVDMYNDLKIVPIG